MKAHCLLRVAALFAAIFMAAIMGCEYDGATALYNQKHEETGTPQITGLNPAAAVAGVNYITILGQNFSAEVGKNKVYFDGAEAEIVNESATSLTVRRPAEIGDSTTAKVVAYEALEVAKYAPYRIDPVMQLYGSIVENMQLSVVAVDHSENFYFVETVSRNIVKVTSGGQKTVVGVAARVPTDARIGPGERLYMTGNNRSIEVFDPQTGLGKDWRRCPSGKVVKFGDFDANGYFYTGGTRSDLVIVAPDSTFRSAGVYTGASDIIAVRVYNGYVYLAVKATAQSTPSIWRHSIDASGNLGPQELVLDWASAGVVASATLRSLAFSADGIMYIGTNSTNPIMSLNLSNGSQDTFYKGILPSSADHLAWGSGNYLYMLFGGTRDDVIRIDMGARGQ